MKNILCIDLTQFNHIKIEEVAKIHGLNLDFLLVNKKADRAKLWICLNSGILVAFTTKKISKMIYTDEYMDALSKIEPIKVPKKEVTLTVDGILDKIGKYGMESLSESEKRFLENQ